MSSLQVAFPDLSVLERENIGRECFGRLARVATEIALVSKIDPTIASFVRFEGADRECLEEALDEGRGVVFVSAHFGNFELLARRIAMAGFPCQTIAQRTSCPRTTAFIERTRLRGNLKSIFRGDPSAAKEMLRALKKNEVLGLLIDVDTNVQSVFVDFFGRPAKTPRAAADLALRLDTAVVLGLAFPRNGGYDLKLARIALPQEGDHESKVTTLTQSLTTMLEAAIQEDPPAWAWMHDRWRSQPG